MTGPVQVAGLAVRLGMSRRDRRWGPCPACGAAHTKHDSRPPVSVVGGWLGWWCHACDRTGDAADLASFALCDRPARESGRRFREVLALLEGGEARGEALPVEEPEKVDLGIAAVLRGCTRPTGTPEVAAWLEGRGIDPEACPAGVLPATFGAAWWPRAWSSVWRLVVPTFTGRGELVGLQGRATAPIREGEPKCRWPRGVPAAGLLFACASGRRLLRGQASNVRRLVVVEGLTDSLTATAWGATDTAVLGVASGSPAALRLLAPGLPAGTSIIVATDYDRQGETYAQQVALALSPHPVRRFPFRLAAA